MLIGAHQNIVDVARALGADPLQATAEKVSVWFEERARVQEQAKFTYDPSVSVLPELFSGRMTVTQAASFCEQNGNPSGRQANADAVRAIGPYAIENVSNCYRTPFTAVAIGRIGKTNVYAGIKSPLTRVRDGEAFIVLPGFRMSHRPTESQIDFACSFARLTFARDGLDQADFEYLYAGPSPVGRGRMFHVIHGKDRQSLDADTIDRLLDIYVRGLALAADRGVALRQPSFRGYGRRIDPDAPQFF